MSTFKQRLTVAYYWTYGCVGPADVLGDNYVFGSQSAKDSHLIYQEFLENPLSIVSVFFGWPNFFVEKNYRWQPQSPMSVFKNMIGWEDDADRLKTIWNIFFAIPNLLWHLFLGVFITAKNVAKLFTEFLPTLLMNECDYRYISPENHTARIGCIFFSCLLFIGAAFTSPIKAVYAASNQGFLFGKRLLGISSNEDDLALIFSILAMAISLYISLFAAAVLYPLAVTSLGSLLLNAVPQLTSIISTAGSWINLLPPPLLGLASDLWQTAMIIAQPIVTTLFGPLLTMLGSSVSLSSATMGVSAVEWMGVYSLMSMLENEIKHGSTYRDCTRIPHPNPKIVSHSRPDSELKCEMKIEVDKQVDATPLGQAFPSSPLSNHHAAVFAPSKVMTPTAPIPENSNQYKSSYCC